jgi:hypothetical protein
LQLSGGKTIIAESQNEQLAWGANPAAEEVRVDWLGKCLFRRQAKPFKMRVPRYRLR